MMSYECLKNDDVKEWDSSVNWGRPHYKKFYTR